MTLYPETTDISRIWGVQFYKCLQFECTHLISLTNDTPKSKTTLNMLTTFNNIC